MPRRKTKVTQLAKQVIATVSFDLVGIVNIIYVKNTIKLEAYSASDKECNHKLPGTGFFGSILPISG